MTRSVPFLASFSCVGTSASCFETYGFACVCAFRVMRRPIPTSSTRTSKEAGGNDPNPSKRRRLPSRRPLFVAFFSLLIVWCERNFLAL